MAKIKKKQQELLFPPRVYTSSTCLYMRVNRMPVQEGVGTVEDLLTLVIF